MKTALQEAQTSSTYRYPQLSSKEKVLHNKRHYKVRRPYYQQRSVERIAVLAWMREHPEEVEEIRRRNVHTIIDKRATEGMDTCKNTDTKRKYTKGKEGSRRIETKVTVT